MNIQTMIDTITSDCVEAVVYETDGYGPEIRELCRDCGTAVKILGWLKKRQHDEDISKARKPRATCPPLTPREAEVLSMVADGCNTFEIARKLAYSERTVKLALCAVTSRYGLRNRAHAVAYAVRNGLI